LNRFPLIIVDESTDARITEALVDAGYEIFSVQQVMHGIDDSEIIKISIEKEGFILTEDKDFGDEIVFRRASNNGAMLLRLSGVEIDEKIRLVLTSLEAHSEELIRSFSVLTKKKLRIRK
jgi:predicted nuclease of predicted toxin-antitoxin system